MAFVSEEIIGEEKKQYFKSIGFTSMLGKPVVPDWWAIDRERNIILTSRGGVIGEAWIGYQLYIDEEFVNMEVVKQSKGSRFNKDIQVKYIIEKMEVPQRLYQKEYTIKKIRHIVEEAFIGWGYPGVKSSQLMQVTVEFKV